MKVKVKWDDIGELISKVPWFKSPPEFAEIEATPIEETKKCKHQWGYGAITNIYHCNWCGELRHEMPTNFNSKPKYKLMSHVIVKGSKDYFMPTELYENLQEALQEYKPSSWTVLQFPLLDAEGGEVWYRVPVEEEK